MWTATQVHGAAIVVAGGPEFDDREHPEADGLVAVGGADCVAVRVADCAAVALGSDEGVVGAVHAGWRGLAAGVIEAAVGVMRTRGATRVSGAVGPCIRPCCYRFSPADMEPLVARYGGSVRGVTTDGAPALDVPAAVGAALRASDVVVVGGPDACTGCDPAYFSHRARADVARQALLVWWADP